MAVQTVGRAAPRRVETKLPQSITAPTAAPTSAPRSAPVDAFEGARAPARNTARPVQALDLSQRVADPGKYMHDMLTGAAPIPADFQRVMGYTPVRVETKHGTRMQDPNGDVSSPGGIGPTEEFLPAAKTHDLGYDLLRYFGRIGQPLGPEARKAADAQFREDCFHEANDDHSGLDKWRARTWAQIYATAVELNSRRQNYGVP